MYLKTILCLVAMLICISSSYGLKKCEKETLTECNKEFMATYEDQQHLKRDKGQYMKLYCRGYQRFGNCLSSTAKTCNGTYVDIFRLLIAEHMMIDKRTRICPDHDFKTLKMVVKGNVEKGMNIPSLSKLEASKITDCMKQINQKCADVMATSLLDSNKMCRDVEKFLGCYRNPGIACNAESYQIFVDDSNRFGQKLLKIEESRPGMLPNC